MNHSKVELKESIHYKTLMAITGAIQVTSRVHLSTSI